MWAYLRNVGRKNGKENSRPMWKYPERSSTKRVAGRRRGVRGVCVRGETEIWQLCAERPETTRTALNRRVQRADDTYTGSVPT